MATNKAEVTTKKTTTKKASSTGKKMAKPVVQSTAKKSDKAAPKSAARKSKKERKVKTIRDFTMPQIEYQQIAEIKEACLKVGIQVKKSEVLRAGLQALAGMGPAQLKRAIARLNKINIGRSKKS